MSVVAQGACRYPAVSPTTAPLVLAALPRVRVLLPALSPSNHVDPSPLLYRHVLPQSLEHAFPPPLPLCPADVFYYALKAVLYPLQPLYDRTDRVMRQAAVRALKRIFIIFDQDKVRGAAYSAVVCSSTCKQRRSCCLSHTTVGPDTASSALSLGTRIEGVPQRRPLLSAHLTAF